MKADEAMFHPKSLKAIVTSACTRRQYGDQQEESIDLSANGGEHALAIANRSCLL
ncbi:hypothetical protein PGT21_020852 [Puccinia graminis f. sp. tritici]|uniref:Uncharacterized protein n=1 Tax=Puccinia graminis f. sp. tritici TaxID=56615 RepID=A0A5B0MCF4_PUCGR|nr:hypothetical protein PGT21_020852 [Puccinia graminis f. sp. tritici]